MTRKYRKRPVIVEAVQLTERRIIHTLEGTLVGEPGDWLITGVRGEQYPCKPDVFEMTYEPVEKERPDETNAQPDLFGYPHLRHGECR